MRGCHENVLRHIKRTSDVTWKEFMERMGYDDGWLSTYILSDRIKKRDYEKAINALGWEIRYEPNEDILRDADVSDLSRSTGLRPFQVMRVLESDDPHMGHFLKLFNQCGGKAFVTNGEKICEIW